MSGCVCQSSSVGTSADFDQRSRHVGSWKPQVQFIARVLKVAPVLSGTSYGTTHQSAYCPERMCSGILLEPVAVKAAPDHCCCCSRRYASTMGLPTKIELASSMYASP